DGGGTRGQQGARRGSILIGPDGIPSHPPSIFRFRTMTTSTMTSPAYPDTRLLIDNQWVDAADGRTLDVLNPATGQAIGRVAHAGIPDLDRALAAAQRGFETWRDTPAHERSEEHTSELQSRENLVC